MQERVVVVRTLPQRRCHFSAHLAHQPCGITPGKWDDDSAHLEESAFCCGTCSFVANHTTVTRNSLEGDVVSVSEDTFM